VDGPTRRVATIRFMAIRSEHAPLPGDQAVWRRVDRPLERLPLTAYGWKEGKPSPSSSSCSIPTVQFFGCTTKTLSQLPPLACFHGATEKASCRCCDHLRRSFGRSRRPSRGAVPHLVPRHVFSCAWEDFFRGRSRRQSGPFTGYRRSPAASPRVFRPMHGGTTPLRGASLRVCPSQAGLVGRSALAVCQSYRRSGLQERTDGGDHARWRGSPRDSNRYDDEIH